MAHLETIEVPISGMDCAECTRHVEHAISALPGVDSVEVLLTAEKAVVRLDKGAVSLPQISAAVQKAGYQVPETQAGAALNNAGALSRKVITTLALVVGVVLFVLVVGEWMGLFERITEEVPFWVGALLVILGGLPIFIDVIRSIFRLQITSRTLMTLGVIAALAVGQWTTAAVVVFLMHVGNYVEDFTARQSRRAVRDLAALTPQMAHIEREGKEVDIPASEVRIDEVVVVRPGEKIPVDGVVISGQATLDQAAITGESMPVEAGPGTKVFAATLAQLGSLRVQVTHTGRDTTFGRVIRLVEEAEAKRGPVQQFADKFSGWYLPVVSVIAVLTLILSGNPLNATAVLVVACACSIALATPIAMMASIGAGAKRGIMIKGGRFLELLDRADVLLLDKTGTLTLGRPQVTDIIPLNGYSEEELLRLAASAERYSEHPLAKAVRRAAHEKQIALQEISVFQALPGMGVKAVVEGHEVVVGSRRLAEHAKAEQVLKELESAGKTTLLIEIDKRLCGVIAAADTLRSEVPASIERLKHLGVKHIELLTGDNPAAAQALANILGILVTANLLPEDKIEAVKRYQAQGHRVVMIGDGINDAPALAQADIGIAMGVHGSDIALQAADIALMREDWSLVPDVFAIALRTMAVVRLNLAFTAAYNIIGISLAAFGILPPALAAAAQSLPDLGILVNSSRLLRFKA
jgi:Cd2+/Zn2+-exporting ATPase/Cu+-exporting ATPase